MEPEDPLDALMSRWRGPLIGLLASWGASFGEAAELAQDTFVEAWLGRERYEGQLEEVQRVGPWLRGIARNLFQARRRKLRPAEPLHEVREPAEELGTEEDPRIAAVRMELDRLPDKERAALYMHYLEEASVREVAALLGVSEKTVEGRLYRGRQWLRERLLEGASESGGAR